MGEEYRSKYGDKDKTVDVVLIEEKGSGISLMQDLRRSGVPCHPYNPGRADKVTRVHAVAPLLESGLVYLPESKKNPGRAPSWTDAMMHELMIFPNGEHDDMVDSMTQALIYLRDTRMLNIDGGQSEDSYVPPKERSNPYAA
jgi:predicted phage terminase large subunit-like protein